MPAEVPIPLDKRVVVRKDKVGGLQKKAKEEGVVIPRSRIRPRLGATAIIDMANSPVGVPVEAYQRSLEDKYDGRVAYAQEREQAFSVRKQFSEFFEEATPDN